MKDLNISVVIPNYNGAHLFPETLPPLFKALEKTGREFEVIISDDCSTDHSDAYIRADYPSIIFIRSEVNSGFAVTINKGISMARYELTFLLNSDVKVSEDYFDHLFGYFKNPLTFGVMGKIIGWDDNWIQDAAKFPVFEGLKLKTSYNYLIENSEGPLLTMYLSGANALVNTSHLKALGGFDELYSPFYMEDVDLSVRAWRTGLMCYFEPLAICRHRTSSSIANKETRKRIRRIYNRNKFYFHAIHHSGFYLIAWSIQILAELVLRIITLRVDYLLSFADFIGSLDRVRAARRKITGKTQISLKDLVFKIRASSYGAQRLVFKR